MMDRETSQRRIWIWKELLTEFTLMLRLLENPWVCMCISKKKKKTLMESNSKLELLCFSSWLVMI